MTDTDSNYSDDIDGSAYTPEEKKRIVLAEARATLARLDTKTAATTIKTKATAMTIKPEPDETYSAWLDRCIPNAMAGDPDLTRDRAADQCAIIFEERVGASGSLDDFVGNRQYARRDGQAEGLARL